MGENQKGWGKENCILNDPVYCSLCRNVLFFVPTGGWGCGWSAYEGGREVVEVHEKRVRFRSVPF